MMVSPLTTATHSLEDAGWRQEAVRARQSARSERDTNLDGRISKAKRTSRERMQHFESQMQKLEDRMEHFITG